LSQKLKAIHPADIHNLNRSLQQVKSRIQRELPKETVEVISDYDKVMVGQTLSKVTRLKHLLVILNLSRMLSKSWDSVTKKDVDELVYKIMKRYGNENGQETHSSFDHKKILKIFFRWLKLGSREYTEVGNPPEIQHVRLKKVRDRIIREDLITEEDRIKLLHACGENSRDRAFIDTHLEAGTRPGEILSLTLKNVKFDKYGAVFHVDGKTGARTVRLVRSTPNLASWLAVHPNKNDPNAPLWPNQSYNHYGKPLSYAGARRIIIRRVKIANIPKRVYLNLFRHSEATLAANFMTEAQMRIRHGWTPESKMPGRYVHLVNADVDEAIFEFHGIKTKKSSQPKLPQKCQVCEMVNPSEADICSKCGKPLNLEAAFEIEGKEKQMLEDRIARQEQTINTILTRLDNLQIH